MSECDDIVSSAAAPRKSTKKGDHSQRPAREHLQSSVLEELWSIWQANPRVPSAKSRRSWAISRNASPRLVGSWFLRRRTCAKKAGQPISAAPYDLPLDLPITPKREQSTTPLESELDAIPGLPSDDTLVYPPDTDDLNDVEASSDTVFDGAIEESKGAQTPAYKEDLEKPRPNHHPSESKPSSADLYAAKDRCDENVPFEDLSFLICSQGQGKQSSFTCILCSTQPGQGTTSVFPTKSAYMHTDTSDDDALPDSNKLSNSRGTSFVPPHPDVFPGVPSELSAIPFLFCTPRAVLPSNTVSLPSARDWPIVEDELGRLVNDGKLDLSFLDVPHLASMVLFD